MHRWLLALLLLPFAAALAPTNPGDLNGDLVVNSLDLSLIASCFGQPTTCQGGKADPNGDGRIDIFDFVQVGQYWSRSYGTSSPPQLLLQENFEDNQLSTRGWYDSPNGLLAPSEHVVGSTASMEYRFNQGGTTPTQGKTARHAITPTDRFYVSFWIKYSSNWVGSQVSYHPHQFHFISDLDSAWIGPSVSHSTFYIEENGGKPILSQQDALNIDQSRVNQNLIGVSEDRAAAGCNGNADTAAYQCYAYNTTFQTNAKSWKSGTQWFANTPGTTYKNDWHFIEAYFQMNSVQNGVGVADGVAQYWYDGQTVLNVTNALFRTGANANMKVNQFIIAPYIGVGSPVQQSFWIDNLTVMTGRPGSFTPPPIAPSITLSANPTSIASGSSSILTWSSTNTNSCAASGGWSGNLALSGTQTVGPTATTDYTVTCTGSGGSATQTTTVTVTLPSNPCGNGIIDAGEQCDAANMNGATCMTRGFTGGTLACTSACVYDTSGCTSTPPSSQHPNEPVGMLPYADLPFDAASPSFTTGGNIGFPDATTYVPPTSAIGTTIQPPGPGPESPGGVFQIKMPYHMTSGRGSGSGTASGTAAKTLYVSGWFQVSSNWYGENTQPPGTGVIKMIMPEVQSTSWSAVANRLIISAAHGSGTNPLTARVAWQQIVTVNGSTGVSTSYFAPKSGTGSVQRGQWHHIEFVTVANSPGVADGRFQMWLDGKETHNVQGIQYDPSADIKWQRVNLNSVYGGPTNVNATPDDQYIWWDHLYVSYSLQQK